jgi:mRNA interferase MazF
MVINIVRIGNSKGIRIPRAILEQCRIESEVSLEVENGKIVLEPVTSVPRQGWKEALNRMHEAGGNEIEKTRPCVVVSPNEMNHATSTVMIAPMTTKSRDYPTRVPIRFRQKSGWIVLDQLRTVDKRRIVRRLGSIGNEAVGEVKRVLAEMLVR